MSLLKCPKCNKEISHSTGKCPHCGYVVTGKISVSSTQKQSIKSVKDKVTNKNFGPSDPVTKK